MSNEVDMEAKEQDLTENVNFLRKVARKYMELNRFKTAQYWAEKVVTLSGENEHDVHFLALTLYSAREYHRASYLITSKNLHKTNAQCCYLAASCMYEAKQFAEAMEILDSAVNIIDELGDKTVCDDETPEPFSSVKLLGNSLLSCIHFETGRTYEAMEKRDFASEYFKEALKADVYCYEAFAALIEQQMLTSAKEANILSTLPFSKHCPGSVDQDLIKYLYESKLNKYRSTNTFETTAPSWLVARMENSLDIKVSDAEKHYYNCNVKQCFSLTTEVLSRDSYHMACLPVHISCLVEQKNSNDLFLLAHRLVEIYPENGISWFAVGCYYYIIGKNDCARRYLGKATTLDKLFGPAWLAYGHSFAADSEHDQAMAAYFKAAQLMVGCHLPLLYIGLENGLTNNATLAVKFFEQAHRIAPNDPFVLHEMGVIAFQSSYYDKARKYFEEALEKIKINEKTVLQRKWEPLLNNLGHVYRKQHLYDKALECHRQAMVLVPNNHSTYAAIGFCEILSGQVKKSIETFHKALSIKRDDTFSTTMLNYALDLHVQEGAFDAVQISSKDLLKTGKEGPSEMDDAMKLIRSSFAEAESEMDSPRPSSRSSGSTVMSTEPSFVDVTNTHEKL